MSLKELTWEKHQNAERTKFSQKMISGKITNHEYSLYLLQMSRIYFILEKIAKDLGITKNLKGIERTVFINQDLIELVGEDHGLEYLPSTNAYEKYLENIKSDPNVKKKILAHMYVRHMGDLYGGQIISKRTPGSGRFYHFENKDDLILGIRSLLSDDLCEEANIAFDYNISILEELNNV